MTFDVEGIGRGKWRVHSHTGPDNRTAYGLWSDYNGDIVSIVPNENLDTIVSVGLLLRSGRRDVPTKARQCAVRLV